MERVLCTVPCDRFEVEIFRGWKHHNMAIGFAARDTQVEVEGDMDRKGFLLFAKNCQLCERQVDGPRGKNDLPKKAVVSITKDYTHKALIFRVDGMGLFDKKGNRYGRRDTGLSFKDFEELVGAVAIYGEDDEVTIKE